MGEKGPRLSRGNAGATTRRDMFLTLDGQNKIAWKKPFRIMRYIIVPYGSGTRPTSVVVTANNLHSLGNQ